MPEPQIIDTSVITVASTTKDNYHNLVVTPTVGSEIRIAEKRSSLFDVFQVGKAVKLYWAVYMDKKYVARAELFDGMASPQAPLKPGTPQLGIEPYPPQPSVPVESKSKGIKDKGIKEESSISGQERGMWAKEAGELIRMWRTHPSTLPQTEEKKTQPWALALIVWYQITMCEVLGIKVEKEQK